MFRVFTKTQVRVIIGLVLLLLSASTVFAQDTDYCDLSEFIEYGDVVDGTVDDDNSFVLFCFEGNVDDEVTIVMDNIDGDLIPALGIGDQFLTEVFVEDYARNRRDSAEINFVLPEDGFYVLLVTREDLDEGETEGDFELSLEAVIAEPMDNPCSSDQMMEYGDSARGEIVDDDVFVTFCFEGYSGDVVFINVETTRDDLEPILALWDPFEEAVIEENLNNRGRDTVDIEYELEVDMVYMIIISRIDFEDGDTEGRFRVSLDAEESSRSRGGLSLDSSDEGDTCNDYPLNVLSQYQWGIPGSEPDEPLLAYTVGCLGEMVSTVVGRHLVLTYDIDSRGNMEFEVGDTVYETVSVDEDEWVLDTSEGDSLTLERLEDDGCDEEPLAQLIRGAWKFEGTDELIFDYACNGVVLVTLDGETSVGTYEYRRGDITIELDDEVLEFVDVEFDNGEMSFESDGDLFVLINTSDQ